MSPLVRPTPTHTCWTMTHGGWPFETPTEPVGTTWDCPTCGRVWVVEPWPDVARGVQRVGNRWARAGWWRARQHRRRVRGFAASALVVPPARPSGYTAAQIDATEDD